jgi:DNA-binding LacI/PurR family transcriptional regulator
MANIYDVARMAGVSISTVSHVLNHTRFVSDETRQRVLDAIEELNYRPSSVARALVRQATQTVAFIVPDNTNPFFAEMARGIEDFMFTRGYSVILCDANRQVEKEHAYIDMLISKRVDGVVCCSTEIYSCPQSTPPLPDYLDPLRQEGIPLVIFEREYEGIDAVLLDNFRGGYETTRHLIELGHRRIGCITGPHPLCRSRRRQVGYQQALADAGLLVDESLIAAGDWTYSSGHQGAQALFERPDPPTAIVACNDAMAIGALTYFHKAQVAVPGQVSVTGFDNIILSAFTWPPITTWVTPIEEVGQKMCEMLLQRINGELPPVPQRLTVSGQLLVRESTARAVESNGLNRQRSV